jgi:hypothetical protein
MRGKVVTALTVFIFLKAQITIVLSHFKTGNRLKKKYVLF